MIFQRGDHHARGRVKGFGGPEEEHWTVPGGIQEALLQEEASKVRAIQCIVVSLPRKCQQIRRQSVPGREKEVSRKTGVQKGQVG